MFVYAPQLENLYIYIYIYMCVFYYEYSVHEEFTEDQLMLS